jgi:hypothetical protein
MNFQDTIFFIMHHWYVHVNYDLGIHHLKELLECWLNTIVFWDLTLKSNTIHSLNVFCCVYLYTITFFHKINQTFFMKSQLGRLCLYWCNCGLFEEEKTAERYTKNPLLFYAYMFTIMSKKKNVEIENY